MFTCKTRVNMYSAIQTVQYGPISVGLAYSSGLAPLKMYRELQRDMGTSHCSYCTVHVFTHVLQVNVFLVCSDETHANFTLLHMLGLAVG